MSIDNRPRFLNLLKIYMPVTAVVSIIHRISGVILSLFVPFAVYLLGLSLEGSSQYEQAMAMFHSMVMKLVLFLVVMSLLFHLLAGIRFLLLDFDIGDSLKSARATAWVVLVLVISIAGLLLVRSVS